MFSKLHGAGYPSEGGLAVTGLAAVAAAVFVALAVTAVVLSVGRKDEASTAPAARERATRQAEAAAQAETVSSLKNAATAMELWSTENAGSYAGPASGGSYDHLVANGLQLPPGVSLTIVSADADGYCLRATHGDLPAGNALFYSSEVGTPRAEPCT